MREFTRPQAASDDLCYISSSSSGGQTISTLSLARVSRVLTNKVLTCQVSNTALVPPRHASLQLELVLAPERLEVESDEESLAVVLGQTVGLTCTARGARPLPTILWQGKHILSQEELRYQVGSVRDTASLLDYLYFYKFLQFVLATCNLVVVPTNISPCFLMLQ